MMHFLKCAKHLRIDVHFLLLLLPLDETALPPGSTTVLRTKMATGGN